MYAGCELVNTLMEDVELVKEHFQFFGFLHVVELIYVLVYDEVSPLAEVIYEALHTVDQFMDLFALTHFQESKSFTEIAKQTGPVQLTKPNEEDLPIRPECSAMVLIIQ